MGTVLDGQIECWIEEYHAKDGSLLMRAHWERFARFEFNKDYDLMRAAHEMLDEGVGLKRPLDADWPNEDGEDGDLFDRTYAFAEDEFVRVVERCVRNLEQGEEPSCTVRACVAAAAEYRKGYSKVRIVFGEGQRVMQSEESIVRTAVEYARAVARDWREYLACLDAGIVWRLEHRRPPNG